ncbi:MAG TPA: hypothetical protein VE173_10620, partial [Longimicrobiales bacterium]|nr:hypothetical protein [Longimicrobiales bacterium]
MIRPTSICVSLLALLAAACSSPPAYDIIVEHGTIIDGTGSDGRPGDIGIQDGRITAIGDLSSAAATRRVDATGKVVAPGF